MKYYVKMKKPEYTRQFKIALYCAVLRHPSFGKSSIYKFLKSLTDGEEHETKSYLIYDFCKGLTMLEHRAEEIYVEYENIDI